MTNVVYFAASNGLIKIGTTIDLSRRIESLRSQSASPVHVIGYYPGGADYERATHDCLVDYRRHGEWFFDCPAVRQVISTVLNHGFEAAGISPLSSDRHLTETVAQAIKLAMLIVEHSGLRPREAEQHFGLPINSLWSLRYRSPKQINADVYFALMKAAGLAIDAARSRLADDQAFVSDLVGRHIDRPAMLDGVISDLDGYRQRLRALLSGKA